MYAIDSHVAYYSFHRACRDHSYIYSVKMNVSQYYKLFRQFFNSVVYLFHCIFNKSPKQRLWHQITYIYEELLIEPAGVATLIL